MVLLYPPWYALRMLLSRKTRTSAVSLATLTLVSACSETETRSEGSFSGGQLEIHFAGRVGEEPFACGETYSGLGKNGTMAMSQDLRFFVSNVRLLTADGEEVPFEIGERERWQTDGVALLDFEDGTGPCETNGNEPQNHHVSGKAPEGEYVGLAFSISVPEELNHEDPTTAKGPLQVTAMQWNWLLGYKFLRAELKPMTHGEHDPGGMGSSEHGGDHALDSQFHLGSLGCVAQGNPMGPPSAPCAKTNRNELRFASFSPTEQLIVADLAAMMHEIDLGTTNHCHGAPHSSCPSFYASVGLDFESGGTVVGQTAFRIADR